MDTMVIGVLPEVTADVDVEWLAERAFTLANDGADAVSLDARDPWAATEPGLGTLRSLMVRMADLAVPVGVMTSVADVAVVTIDQGARWIQVTDPSAADQFLPTIIAAAGVDVVVAQPRPAAGALLTPDDYYLRAFEDAGRLLAAGVAWDRIVLDAGLGPLGHGGSWTLLDHLDRMRALGHPIFVDAAYLQMVADLSVEPVEYLPTADELDAEALGLAAIAGTYGAWGVRVHNVARTVLALRGYHVAVAGLVEAEAYA